MIAFEGCDCWVTQLFWSWEVWGGVGSIGLGVNGGVTPTVDWGEIQEGSVWCFEVTNDMWLRGDCGIGCGG